MAFKNELCAELTGVMSINPWVPVTSASRLAMDYSHISQALVISGVEPQQCFTGMAREFGKYTFSAKANDDIEIIRIIPRYQRTAGVDSIDKNPQLTVIYQITETRQIGVMEITDWCSYHQSFGFKYKKNKENINRLKLGAAIPKGTIFADSPAVRSDGNYGFGVNLRTAFMSLPGVSEDGFIITRKALEKLKFKTYHKRVIKYGNTWFPLNIYGNAENPKVFPEIGETVREDGLLMALRSFDPLMAPCEQSIEALMSPNYVFDKFVYVPPGGKVVDIKVYSDRRHNPVEIGPMDHVVSKYCEQLRKYYKTIVEVYKKLKQERGESLSLTPAFQTLVKRALIITDNEDSPIQFNYHSDKLDRWRIEIIVEVEVTPNLGFKLSGISGDKGVICTIVDDENEMPVDANGNRAEIVASDASTANRENPGRMFEQYFNAAARDTRVRLIKILGLNEKDIIVSNLEELISQRQTLDTAFDHLLGYYKIVMPHIYEAMISGRYKKSKAYALASVISEKIYNNLPVNIQKPFVQIVQELEKEYPQTYGPVTFEYTNDEGVRQTITSKEKVRIGDVYFMLLEKTGDQRSAVSTAPLQQAGVLARMGPHDRYSVPVRSNPVRVLGEAEVRAIGAACGPELACEIVDRNTSHASMEAITTNVLTADVPTNIENVVDRRKVPLGGSRPLQLLNHIGECAGWKLVYRPYKR